MIKKIFHTLLIIVGILGIIDTALILPISSGITLGVLLPAMIGVVFIIYGILKLWLKGGYIIKKKVLRRILTTGICLFIALFLFVEALIIGTAYSEQDKQTETNYVIVLGCGIFSDGRLTLTLKKRLDVAYDYLITYPDATCIVSGGQGPFEPTSEAEAMANYLVSIGIEEDRIIKEEESTSSRENLIYSNEIIKTYDKEPTIAIVSSDFHIFRAKMLARRYGMEAIGLPCDTSWYLLLNVYLREFFAVIKSFVFD